MTLKLVLTFWGTVYVTAILSFRYLRMAADALGVRRELRGLLLFLNIPGGLLLIVTGGEALINAIELRPSFVVGVLTFWFALRGVSRTKGANRTYAGRWGDNTTVGGGSPRLRVEPPPPCSESVARTLALARSEALAHGQAFVGTHHLLIALARPECGWTGEAFAAQGVTPGRLRVAFSAHLEREAVEVPAGDLPITPAVRRAVEQAETAAKAIGLEGATPEQLLLVLLGDSKSIVSDTLVGMGIDPNRVRESLMNDQPPSSKV